MLRILLTYLLPLLAPVLLYMGWTAWARRRALATGEEPPSLEKSSIFWSLIAGLVLMIAALAVLALTGGRPADDVGKYKAPHLEDGRIVGPSYGEQ